MSYLFFVQFYECLKNAPDKKFAVLLWNFAWILYFLPTFFLNCSISPFPQNSKMMYHYPFSLKSYLYWTMFLWLSSFMIPIYFFTIYASWVNHLVLVWSFFSFSWQLRHLLSRFARLCRRRQRHPRLTSQLVDICL